MTGHTETAFVHGVADVEPGVVINLAVPGGVAAVDVHRLVGHLGRGGKPALAGGIDERPRLDPG